MLLGAVWLKPPFGADVGQLVLDSSPLPTGKPKLSLFAAVAVAVQFPMAAIISGRFNVDTPWKNRVDYLAEHKLGTLLVEHDFVDVVDATGFDLEDKDCALVVDALAELFHDMFGVSSKQRNETMAVLVYGDKPLMRIYDAFSPNDE